MEHIDTSPNSVRLTVSELRLLTKYLMKMMMKIMIIIIRNVLMKTAIFQTAIFPWLFEVETWNFDTSF